ncbi:hypothetical protein L917_04211 [Phytophthora nicotianae]|uniref:Uncharacterized protein n=2 Tax=Phytophthora nicotianae TaxID=4792 RepID=W2NVF2_PHYNI|nr:hypothetical protein L917_04211 [Phytophthora nicotianae]ETM51938.1 hypothetical protein L914_04314 [Phytophthora nicotianae]ETO81094.1 hypothetical protein F444_04521 [Phytophthora nicotianae P1976]
MGGWLAPKQVKQACSVRVESRVAQRTTIPSFQRDDPGHKVLRGQSIKDEGIDALCWKSGLLVNPPRRWPKIF